MYVVSISRCWDEITRWLGIKSARAAYVFGEFGSVRVSQTSQPASDRWTAPGLPLHSASPCAVRIWEMALNRSRCYGHIHPHRGHEHPTMSQMRRR